MQKNLGRLTRVFAAAEAAPDAVIDRQLRELKVQVPRILIAIALCSALIGARFFEDAGPAVIGCLVIYVSFILLRLPRWYGLDIDALTPAEKRRKVGSTPRVAGGLSIACAVVSIFLAQYADKEGYILLSLWCLFCGVGASMALAALPRASGFPLLMCIIPVTPFLLSTGDKDLAVIAMLMAIGAAIVHFHNKRVGIALAELSLNQQLIEDGANQTSFRFRSFIEAASDWAWEVNAKGELTYISPNFEKLTALSPEKMLGVSALEISRLDNGKSKEAEKEFIRLFEARKSIDGVRHGVIRKDGSVMTVAEHGMPVFDSAGAFKGYVGWSKDISEQAETERKLRESEARYRDFAESAGDWVWEIDADLRYTYISERAREVTGADHSGFIGEKMSLSGNRVSEEDWAALKETIARREPIQEFTSCVAFDNGSSCWIERSAKP
ncbi:MAG: PAS domain-containing protein, partial [Oricola sp.]|nr:PAS domain-containing protein [Oricola sp.]